MTRPAAYVLAGLVSLGSLGWFDACVGPTSDVPRLRIHNSGAVTAVKLDWVGEEPIAGASFTYSIELDPSRPSLQIVRLDSVTKDE